ncbi:PTS sugar transporter subunit IIA [Clostridium sp. P21]|uniref:PTS sugar transporter subunit IIA n=1 Tax=Clostridium muellerianum TaxID=2716538 RepID=A0A7Y0EKW6_9CLOT|nr:PTS sugar transporter subunit IIA [Clostridium muellerianum]NMM65336.1 PTS sugar transporter subunit IIA [Clostridium muellerianum]
MIKEVTQLFRKDLVFIEDAKDSSGIFTKIGKKLLEKGLVNEEFVQAVISREKDYPTGLDLSVVGEGIPNVAIPHTESEYCKAKNVVVVKLNDEIEFNNMISPDNKLKVKFLFMILNNEKEAQSNILSHLMEFFTQNDNVKKLCEISDPGEIYKYITE